MSSPTISSATATPNVPPQLPPVLTEYINGIRPAINILLFCAVWLGISIPLLVVLVYTSSKSIRRSGMFIANVVGISLAIALEVLGVAIETNGILNPVAGLNRSEVVAYTFLTCMISTFVDGILFFRVLVVYPRRTTPKRIWFAIMVPLVLIKIARVVNVVVFICQFVSITKGIPQATADIENTVRKVIEGTIEWSLQLVDNIMCSLLFLWALRKSSKSSRINSTASGVAGSKYSYRKALSSLFWIAMTNMVFPCLFDIVLFVLFFRDPDGTHYLIVLISNNHIQLIGVLFATVWRATRQRNIANEAVAPVGDMSIKFARNVALKDRRRMGELENGIELTESMNAVSIDFDSSNLQSTFAESGSKESGLGRSAI